MDLVSGREPHAVGSPSDEFVVHEDVHVLAEPARFVEDAVPSSREGCVEAGDEGREVRRLEEHLVLSSREGEERGRDPHEDARVGQFLRRDARIQSIPRARIERWVKKTLGGRCAKTTFHPGIDTVFYIHVDADDLRQPCKARDRDGSLSLVVVDPVASERIGFHALLRGPRPGGVRVDTFNEIVDL